MLRGPSRQWRLSDPTVRRHCRTGWGVLHHFGNHLHGARPDDGTPHYTFNVVANQQPATGPPSTTAAVTPASVRPGTAVKAPREIALGPRGKTVLLKGGDDQRGQAKAKVSLARAEYSGRIRPSPAGSTIQTKGEKRLEVTLKLIGPASHGTAYSAPEVEGQK